MGRPVWVTTEAVLHEYGFDPFLYIDSSNKEQIKNQLILNKKGCACCLNRVWLKDDVLRVAVEVAKQQEVDKKQALVRRILSNYPKGLRPCLTT